MKGHPNDNAVAEATSKVMKAEFVYQMDFQSLHHLELEFFDYINCYNKHRIHETVDYGFLFFIETHPLK
ncbi:IS3 family transposase [Paenibacillus sp. F4]|uniref:IS3 family transposase n=1 Tax=Paenibacillus sp. F4 TaxID=357385 RepID=UPI0011AEE879